MSANVLRKAAALMRGRAFATEGALPIWYQPESTGIVNLNRSDAEFIAAMTPAVALAVADWLEHQAVASEFHERQDAENEFVDFHVPRAGTTRALAVARAYLNEETP